MTFRQQLGVILEMFSLPTVVHLNDVIHDGQGYSQPALLSLHCEMERQCNLFAVLSYSLCLLRGVLVEFSHFF